MCDGPISSSRSVTGEQTLKVGVADLAFQRVPRLLQPAAFDKHVEYRLVGFSTWTLRGLGTLGYYQYGNSEHELMGKTYRYLEKVVVEPDELCPALEEHRGLCSRQT